MVPLLLGTLSSAAFSVVHREGMLRTTLWVRCPSLHNKARKWWKKKSTHIQLEMDAYP